jgi:hypothetical protein
MTRFAIVSCVLLLVIALGTSVGRADDQIGIQVSPSTINLAYEGTWVTVHADIPYGAVLTASLTLNDVPVRWTKADSRGDLVAKFEAGSVKGIFDNVALPATAILKLCGVTRDGVPFFGTDTVLVINQSGKR